MTRTVIIGAQGQLGSELLRRLPEAKGLTRNEIDLSHTVSVATALDQRQPTCVINAAAYNFVDRAEEEPGRAVAWEVNSQGPRRLASWCAEHGATLVHISTDYVFGLDSTRDRPYREDDIPAPLNAYGLSKLAGEQAVLSGCPRHFVLRTCGLYGSGRSQKGNFVLTMLRLGRERDELRVVDDQRCTPTSASDLAEAIIALLNTREYGLYHATNEGSSTWREFAEEIFRISGLDVRVVPITSAEYGARAARPAYSILDCSRLARVIGQPLPEWRTALRSFLRRVASDALPEGDPR